MTLSRSRPRPAVVLLAALGLAFSLTACGSGDAEGGAAEEDTASDESAAAESGSSASTDPDEDPADAKEPEAPATETPEADPELDHPAVLAAGFDGTAAIRCHYTYDAEELAQFAMLPNGGEVTTEATIYLDRGTIYWDIPQPDGGVAHVLGRAGSVYSWSDGSGVQGPDEADSRAILEEKMTRNAGDCVIYDGPASIFEVPSDVGFTVVGG